MKHIEEIEIFILESLKGVLGDNFSDIPKIYLYSHFLESTLISAINANRLGFYSSNSDDYSCVLNKMVNLGLLSSEIVEFYNANKDVISKRIPGIYEETWNVPHAIHEDLLARELNISDHDVWFASDKISRDTTGSYYTPSDLAFEVVREAVERYLRMHHTKTKKEVVALLSKTNFADLSCGCGEFIKALIKYLNEEYEIEPQHIATNFYGIDIDPIALQITICDLLEFTDQSKWDNIISHFTLGNPLINQKNEKGTAEKTRLFALKHFYSLDMGIDIKRLFNGISIDIVVGNPPWEKVRFEERKFFKPFMPKISEMAQKNKRQANIKKLQKNAPVCYAWYQEVFNDYVDFKGNITGHPLINKTTNGELNTYSLFTEMSLNMIDDAGVTSLIVKSALVTSPVNKPFFNYVLETSKLASLCLFDNTLRVFSIDSREKFCVFTSTKVENKTFELISGAKKTRDLHTGVRINLSAREVAVINPNTLMIPNVSSNSDIEVLLDAHQRLPLFETVYPSCHFGRLVHLTAHANHIDTVQSEDNIPIYEGKFIERYNARFTTFADVSDTQKYSAKAYAKKLLKSDVGIPLPESRYFIKRDYWDKISSNYSEPYMLCWRSLTSATNSRTTLAMLLPTMPTCQSIQFLQTKKAKDLLIMLALLNSKPFDYFVRLKMPGIDLTQSVIRQIPVPKREDYKQTMEYMGVSQSFEQHILERIASVLSTEPMALPILKECNLPFETRQKKKPSVLEKELDDLFFDLYGFYESEIKTVRGSFKN